MTYTVKLEIDIEDTGDILSDEELFDYLRLGLELPTIDIKDIQVLEVND